MLHDLRKLRLGVPIDPNMLLRLHHLKSAVNDFSIEFTYTSVLQDAYGVSEKSFALACGIIKLQLQASGSSSFRVQGSSCDQNYAALRDQRLHFFGKAF